jgi:hypothetical protein
MGSYTFKNSTAKTVKLPLINVTTAPIEIQNNRTIPTGTRLQVIDFGGIIGGVKKSPSIKVIDGPLTGTVANINTRDLAKLAPERP